MVGNISERGVIAGREKVVGGLVYLFKLKEFIKN